MNGKNLSVKGQGIYSFPVFYSFFVKKLHISEKSIVFLY